MPVSASIRPASPVTSVNRTDPSVAGRLFDEINAYRQSQGLSGLQRHAGLDRLAREHCEYLRQNRGTFSLYGRNVSHYGFDGRALVAREQYQMASVSENVAATNQPGNPAPILLALWRDSKDHHKNMTDDWTCSGVGVVVDSDGMVFATQLFATRNLSQLAMRERLTSF
jgi:uncharacterized protein YkwD